MGQLLFEICINLSTFGVPVLCYKHGFSVPTHLRRHFVVFGMPSSSCSSARHSVVHLHSEEHQVSGRIVFEGCSLMLILHASKSVSTLLNLLWQPSLHKVVVMAHA